MRLVGLKEALRRLYYDLVMRRSTVRIVPAKASNLDTPPIFLIGVYRSGTTLLRYIIDSHSQIACPPETDFLAGLADLLDDPLYESGLQNMGYDRAHVAQKLRDLTVYFYGNYAASRNKKRWADKTPSYVDHLDFIHALFPAAQFVMIYRHGLDQAHSYTRGGNLMRPSLQEYVQAGEDLRVAGVRYWQDKVARMIDFECEHPQRCHRIYYENLCNAPEQEIRSLFSFLGEPWEPRVLQYHKFPHDKGNEDGRVGATTGITPGRSHHLLWPSDLRAFCLDLAQPTLSRLGYSSEKGRSAISRRGS